MFSGWMGWLHWFRQSDSFPGFQGTQQEVVAEYCCARINVAGTSTLKKLKRDTPRFINEGFIDLESESTLTVLQINPK